MEIRATWSYTLTLTKSEFLLISKALRGAPMTLQEEQDAIALQTKMVLDKHTMLKQALHESEKTIANIEKEADK